MRKRELSANGVIVAAGTSPLVNAVAQSANPFGGQKGARGVEGGVVKIRRIRRIILNTPKRIFIACNSCAFCNKVSARLHKLLKGRLVGIGPTHTPRARSCRTCVENDMRLSKHSNASVFVNLRNNSSVAFSYIMCA